MGAAAGDCQSGGLAEISRTCIRFLGVFHLVLWLEILLTCGDLNFGRGANWGNACRI